MLNSPIIQSFGGNGSDPSGCVQDGPFNDPTFLNIGPVESLVKNPRCMTRNLDADLFNGGSNWNDIYPPLISRRSHLQVQQFIDGLSFVAESDKVATGAFINPHSLGHSAVGGDVSICSAFDDMSDADTAKVRGYLFFTKRSHFLGPPRSARLHVGSLAEARHGEAGRHWRVPNGRGYRTRCERNKRTHDARHSRVDGLYEPGRVGQVGDGYGQWRW